MSLKIVVVFTLALAAALVSSSTLGTNSNGGLKDLLLGLDGKMPNASITTCFQAESTAFKEQTQERESKARKLCTKISGINETLKEPMEKFAEGFKTLNDYFWPHVLGGDLAGTSAVYTDITTRSWEIVRNITTAADESKNTDLKRQAEKLKDLLTRWERDEKEMTERIEACVTTKCSVKSKKA